MSQASQSRVAYLDGIRGWASLAVLFSHTIPCFLALTTPQLAAGREQLASDLANHDYLSFLIRLLIRVFTNGRLSVILFFILSGYTLSLSQLGAREKNLAKATLSRYFRLMLPVISATFIAFVFFKLGLFYNLKAATKPEFSLNWLGTFFDFDMTFKGFLSFSLFEVFFKYNGDATYNPPLWTMQTEMYGSLFLFAYLAIFRSGGKVNWPSILIATALLLWLMPMGACFCAGYLIAELNKKLAQRPGLLDAKMFQAALLALFMLAVFLSIYFESYEEFDLIVFSAGAMILFSVSFSRPLTRIFSCRLSRFLGKISFSLYLIQFTVICSWSSYLFIKLPQWGLNRVQANYVLLLSTVVMCLLASLLFLPLERRGNQAAKKIAAVILGQQRG